MQSLFSLFASQMFFFVVNSVVVMVVADVAVATCVDKSVTGSLPELRALSQESVEAGDELRDWEGEGGKAWPWSWGL